MKGDLGLVLALWLHVLGSPAEPGEQLVWDPVARGMDMPTVCGGQPGGRQDGQGVEEMCLGVSHGSESFVGFTLDKPAFLCNIECL